MYMWVGLCTWVPCVLRSEDDAEFGAGVSGNCKPPRVGAGVQTWVFWKRSTLWTAESFLRALDIAAAYVQTS